MAQYRSPDTMKPEAEARPKGGTGERLNLRDTRVRRAQVEVAGEGHVK